MADPRDAERLLATIPKNRREEIRITRSAFNGHEFVQLRVWFRADDGEMRPGKAGISIRPNQVDEVVEALKRGAAS